MRTTESTEEVRRILASLITERLALRSQSTDTMLLEANAIAIDYWQERLRRQERAEGPRIGGSDVARRSSL